MLVLKSYRQSEEDIAKKEELDMLVERVQDADAGIQKLALSTMRFLPTLFFLSKERSLSS